MGLDNSSIMFLCAVKAMGVNCEHTATIGRQTFFPTHEVLQRVLRTLDIQADARALLTQPYSEEFFRLLGAKRIESVDASTYEQATIIHDMNNPLPPELNERFTLVHDGGTIEHVFNIPQAYKNCMEMVRLGGHFTQVTVMNNFAGHGFWQISPELIYRLFSANGFEVRAVLVHEVTKQGKWYAVADPDKIHRRVELVNRRPTYILTIAQRVACVPVLERPPQQSDYVALWDRTIDPSPSVADSPMTAWRRHIPPPVKDLVRSTIYRANALRAAVKSTFSPAAYRRVSERDLLHGRLKPQ